jgi:hypothetical protein
LGGRELTQIKVRSVSPSAISPFLEVCRGLAADGLAETLALRAERPELCAQPTPSAEDRFLALSPVHWADVEGQKVSTIAIPDRRQTGSPAAASSGSWPLGLGRLRLDHEQGQP